MSFQDFNLHSTIYKSILRSGYTLPTPIQTRCIPEVIQGRDIVAIAQTGTGKTAAYALPILHHLAVNPASRITQVLILAPTRELANQITQSLLTYGRFIQFRIANLVGGMSYQNQNRDLNRGPNVLVATPGRLLDHLKNNRLKLNQIEVLVLDEADRMLDMGFQEDVKTIIKLTPKKRQTLLFSATMDSRLKKMVPAILNNPLHIDLSQKIIASPQIKHELYKTNTIQDKIRLLRHLLDDSNIYKAIIFSATKINADKLAHQLCHDGFSAAPLHGDLRQGVRNRTLESLKRGKIQFLVATDVAARGIDISDITHVINYDLPKFCEDYVHRVGRTGRAGKNGLAISFVMPSDLKNLQRIERYTGLRLKLIQNVQTNDSERRERTPVNPPMARERRETRARNDSRAAFENGDKRRFSKKLGSKKESNKETFSSSSRNDFKKENGFGTSAASTKRKFSKRSDFKSGNGLSAQSPQRKFSNRNDDSKIEPGNKSTQRKFSPKKKFSFWKKNKKASQVTERI